MEEFLKNLLSGCLVLRINLGWRSIYSRREFFLSFFVAERSWSERWLIVLLGGKIVNSFLGFIGITLLRFVFTFFFFISFGRGGELTSSFDRELGLEQKGGLNLLSVEGSKRGMER